jgi:hypothetical protein
MRKTDRQGASFKERRLGVSLGLIVPQKQIMPLSNGVTLFESEKAPKKGLFAKGAPIPIVGEPQRRKP